MRSLVPGGYLFLGHAETLRGLSQDFHLVHTHGTFYYQRKSEGDEAPRAATTSIPVRRPLRASTRRADAGAWRSTSWFEAIGNAAAAHRGARGRAAPECRRRQCLRVPAWSLAAALDLMQRERFGEALDADRAMPQEAGGDPDVLLLRRCCWCRAASSPPAARSADAASPQDEINAGANYVLGLCFEAAGDRAARRATTTASPATSIRSSPCRSCISV